MEFVLALKSSLLFLLLIFLLKTNDSNLKELTLITVISNFRSAIEYCVKFFSRDVIFPFCHPSIITIFQYWVKSGTRILHSINKYYATPKKSRKVFNRSISSQTYIKLVSYYDILGQWFIFRHLNNLSYKFYYNIRVSKNGVLTHIAKVFGGEAF